MGRGLTQYYAKNTNMNNQSINPSCRRMSDGWAPALAYDNGGCVIAAIRCATMDDAIREASNMIRCILDHPSAFANNHPAPNQLVDLSKR